MKTSAATQDGRLTYVEKTCSTQESVLLYYYELLPKSIFESALKPLVKIHQHEVSDLVRISEMR